MRLKRFQKERERNHKRRKNRHGWEKEIHAARDASKNKTGKQKISQIQIPTPLCVAAKISPRGPPKAPPYGEQKGAKRTTHTAFIKSLKPPGCPPACLFFMGPLLFSLLIFVRSEQCSALQGLHVQITPKDPLFSSHAVPVTGSIRADDAAHAVLHPHAF